MTRFCSPLLVFFMSLPLLATFRPAITAVDARRAVGKRQEEPPVAGKTVVGPVNDSDEWGEKESEENQQEDDGKHGDESCAQDESVSPGNHGEVGGCAERNLEGWSSNDDALRGPVPLSVRDRGLVTTQVSTASILREHQAWHSEETTKNFQGETLGYVTPWHGAGYDFARTFRSKLTYVSPVWYQLRNGGDGDGPSFLLAGGHDFDEAWVSDVRNGIGGGVGTRSGDPGVTKIVPRVVLELRGGFRLSQADLREMAELLVEEAVQKGYDGYVLDIPLSDGIDEFVGGVKGSAIRRGKNLLLIQSVRPGFSLSGRLLDRLVPLIHRFSLMTYDYQPGATEGGRTGGAGVPNSPLSWVKECVEKFAPGGPGSKLRSMTLIGLPFYGYDNGRAITSNDMVSLLTAEQQEQRRGGSVREVSPIFVDWDPLWREHIMSYRRQHDGGRSSTEHVATFPTLAFVQERVDLAQQLGVGVALWELGQGVCCCRCCCQWYCHVNLLVPTSARQHDTSFVLCTCSIQLRTQWETPSTHLRVNPLRALNIR
ncbi:unnamed protein product [Pylaiella littoralis]